MDRSANVNVYHCVSEIRHLQAITVSEVFTDGKL